MALLGSNSEIGANSLEMLSIEEQEFDDYCAGEILLRQSKRGRTTNAPRRPQSLSLPWGLRCRPKLRTRPFRHSRTSLPSPV